MTQPQPPFQQPAYGPQPVLAQYHQPQGPVGCLRITTQGGMWKSFWPPTIKVNGYPVATQYGTIDVPVPPGRYVVEGLAPGLWSGGQAMLNVDVQPGQVVPVYYNAPIIQFISGAIGHEPQKTPGVVALIAILAPLLAVALLCAIMAITIAVTR